MNSCGVSIGMDMVPALQTNPVAPGMGCLLTARYVMQNCPNATSALAAVRNSVTRGVSWMYLIGDATTGAVAEAAAHHGPRLAPGPGQVLRRPPAGLRLRSHGLSRGGHRPDRNAPRPSSSSPTISSTRRCANRAGSYAVKESTARYDYLVGVILQALDAGLDVEKAKELCNYLSPLSSNPYGNDMMANPFGDGSARVGDYYSRARSTSMASGPCSSRAPSPCMSSTATGPIPGSTTRCPGDVARGGPRVPATRPVMEKEKGERRSPFSLNTGLRPSLTAGFLPSRSTGGAGPCNRSSCRPRRASRGGGAGTRSRAPSS